MIYFFTEYTLQSITIGDIWNCTDGSRKISRKDFCDDYNDCHNGEDESKDLCRGEAKI